MTNKILILAPLTPAPLHLWRGIHNWYVYSVGKMANIFPAYFELIT
jgi:hypothetical protein